MMQGAHHYPRLIEFHNSRFVTDDFQQSNLDYLTARPLEFARYDECHWQTPKGEVVTIGEMLKRVYSLCNPSVVLEVHVTDTNPSSPLLMRLKKVFEYRLTLNTPARKGYRATYDLEPLDDVKVFHSLKQFWELEYP